LQKGQLTLEKGQRAQLEAKSHQRAVDPKGEYLDCPKVGRRGPSASNLDSEWSFKTINLQERSGNVLENKGSLWENAHRSRNMHENKGG